MIGEEIPNPIPNPNPNPNPDSNPESNRQAVERTAAGVKRKRNLPGTPDPEAEVIALSPEALLSASTFVCEICGKEFRRDQNLQIHRRGHNLPWNFPQKKAVAAEEGGGKEAARKRVYVCPEETCVYHDPARALGDLTGIKKHYSRKHGEKKWKCDKCSKKYAVRTDWKAHTRICGNREYECLCGTLFSRKDSFIIHRASCEATAESPAAATVDLGFKANTVNNELLFPSLWGQSSSQSMGGREEKRTGGSASVNK